ncbi:uncharacterized protein N7484_006375 [Penicillium longicatenatum]|uniref:uncharacterized protein n=1 Tax=Penicillium longicatenatum TaxID=1561947 RepID=UPI0025495255|nr:uncharacterized protein N7484_006375 [Penicillium longicatenatum]KAJ5643868.1 hypothetical protein N7484_006375 [Penicillium longicatenatum]
MGSNSTHTSLVSWRLDDDSRSAWDILWACGSTIFACTWTVIHADVPNRDATNFRQTIMFLRTWFMALLVPEVIFGFAWLQLTNARESQNMYNVALNHEPTKLKSPETSMHSPPEKLRADPGSETWSLVQAFCINAGALALRTKDEWVYSVLTDEEMVDFITSGTVRPSDLPEQEIQSRAKADSFAKLFTLFQVTWFLCNAFTRWGYHIPVSPLELATVAYVVIAILTYLTWWYKPKDISTPVLVILPCDRRTLEANFPDKIDSHRWTHLKVQVKKETMLDTLKSSLTTSIFVIDPPQEGEVVRKKENKGATILSFISLFIYSFAALAYSGIHLAA